MGTFGKAEQTENAQRGRKRGGGERGSGGDGGGGSGEREKKKTCKCWGEIQNEYQKNQQLAHLHINMILYKVLVVVRIFRNQAPILLTTKQRL